MSQTKKVATVRENTELAGVVLLFESSMTNGRRSAACALALAHLLGIPQIKCPHHLERIEAE